MTEQTKAKTREQVLEAFAMEANYDRDTLEVYLRAYPDYSMDLVELSRELARRSDPVEGSLTPTEISRIDSSWLRYKGVLQKTKNDDETARNSDRSDVADPLANMTADASRDMARELGVKRQVVACFRERRVEPLSVPTRFLRQMASALEIALDELLTLLSQPAQPAMLRSYKADGPPGVPDKESFEEILKHSGVEGDQLADLMREDS